MEKLYKKSQIFQISQKNWKFNSFELPFTPKVNLKAKKFRVKFKSIWSGLIWSLKNLTEPTYCKHFLKDQPINFVF